MGKELLIIRELLANALGLKDVGVTNLNYEMFSLAQDIFNDAFTVLMMTIEPF